MERAAVGKRMAHVPAMAGGRAEEKNNANMKREAGGLGEFLLCPQGKANKI